MLLPLLLLAAADWIPMLVSPEPLHEGSTRMYSTSLYFGSHGSMRRKSSWVTDTQFTPAFLSNECIVDSRDASRSNANIFLNNNTFLMTNTTMTVVTRSQQPASQRMPKHAHMYRWMDKLTSIHVSSKIYRTSRGIKKKPCRRETTEKCGHLQIKSPYNPSRSWNIKTYIFYDTEC